MLRIVPVRSLVVNKNVTISLNAQGGYGLLFAEKEVYLKEYQYVTIHLRRMHDSEMLLVCRSTHIRRLFW